MRNQERGCAATLLRCCKSDENIYEKSCEGLTCLFTIDMLQNWATWLIKRGTALLHYWDTAKLAKIHEKSWEGLTCLFTIEMLQNWATWEINRGTALLHYWDAAKVTKIHEKSPQHVNSEQGRSLQWYGNLGLLCCAIPILNKAVHCSVLLILTHCAAFVNCQQGRSL